MQKTTLSFLVFLGATVATVNLSAQTWYWTKQADSSASQTGSQVAVDRNNSPYYTGYCSGTVMTFGNNVRLNITGSQSDFLVKYDPNGNPLWARNATSLESSSLVYGMSVATDRNNSVLEAGYFNDSVAFGSFHLSALPAFESIYLVKYDASGNVLWATSPSFPAGGSPEILAYSVKSDLGNNIYVTGYFDGTVIFGNDTLSSASELNMFVVKYNSSGAVLWAKTSDLLGASSYAYGLSVATDDSGNAYVSGNFNDSIMFDNVKITNAGTESIYLAKFDSSGNAKWALNTGATPGQVLPTPVSVDKNNHVYLGAQFTNTTLNFGTFTVTDGASPCSNSLLAKYDRNGNVIWATCADFISMDEVCVIIESGVATDQCDNVYWSGLCSDSFGVGSVKVTVAGGAANPTFAFAYVIKLDSNANPIAGAAMKNQNSNSFSNFLAVDSLSKALFVSELVDPAGLIIGSDTVRRYLTNSTCFLSKFAVIPPVLVNNTSHDSICLGDSIVLSVTSASGTTYTWSNGATTSSITVFPTITTTYYVALNDGCNQDTSFIKVVVSSVNPRIAGNDSICSGDTVLLTASGGVTYRWSTSQTTDSIKVSPTVTTTYTLTAYSGGCNKDTTFTVYIKPGAVAGITPVPSDSICSGDSVLLNGSGGITYFWNTGSTSSSIWVNPVISSTYTLHVTAASCPDSTTIHINIIPPTTASINSSPDSICPTQTATLTARGVGGQISYRWNNGLTASTIQVTPSVTTTYTVSIYGKCDTVKDSVTVTVIPVIKPVISGSSTRCKGQKDTLTVSGGTSYLWSNGSTSTTYFTGAINADSTIIVTSFNSLNCTDTAQFKISIAPTPTVNVTYTKVCINNPVVIYANATGAGPFTYTWSPGGQTGDSITVTDTGQTMSLTVSNGCKTIKTFTITSDVPPLYACCDKTIFLGDDTVIVAGGAMSYQWSQGITCLNPPLCDSVKVSPAVTTSYTVTGTDSLGCYTDKVITIIVEEPCFSFTIPNVFTPNFTGPNGLDNIFYIKNTNLDSWSIKIYDRWGKEMYSSTNPNAYWGGTTESADKAPDGVYYYVIKAACQGNSYNKEGFVQLIR